MDWIRLAFGLIRDAVNTDEPPPRREPPPPSAQSSTDFQGLLAEHRATVDRNLEAVVQMLNAQNTKINEINRRQQKWNLALAFSVGVTFLLSILALIYAL